MDNYENTLNIDFRKDFGIFYSPNLITNYIVEECFESYFSNQKFDLVSLQQITILDCACGVGAFLIESFDYLLKKYQNYFPNFPNPQKWIIENNLFGVDIDENAVEICKMQLFEKSGFESQNIKLGNSLIEDKNIDEKAFVWKKEFPLPFQKGGFDLIVGNPPYFNIGKEHKLKESPYFSILANGITNVASLFVKLSIDLLKNQGIVSLIIPKSFLNVNSWLPLRKIMF
jgi:type I restriction-modification system DNA methylase subunit